MKIKKLELYISNLNKQKEFYRDILGFSIISEKKNSFTIKAGWSEVTFTSSEQTYNYHYCFLIPKNKLKEALNWVENRVNILPISDTEKVIHFESWNAKSFYFYDACGNIVEFIVRYDLNYENEEEFTTNSILCLNEIGMPCNDIKAINSKLNSLFRTNFWKGDFIEFGTNGSQEGLFLLPNYTYDNCWLPTNKKITPVTFTVQICQNNILYSFKFQNNKILVI